MALIKYRTHTIILLFVAATALVILHHADNLAFSTKDPSYQEAPEKDPLVHVKKDIPLVWVGGVPRSGTTLMRAMLDAHPDVRCGEETHVIPRMLDMHKHIMYDKRFMERLDLAHINLDVLESALGAYLLSIIELHGPPAEVLCNKDPLALSSMTTLKHMYPSSKFILMVRDGRATAHSVFSRKIAIGGWNKTYRGALEAWNKIIGKMYNECYAVGSDSCLPVYYEQLVLHPESQMRSILKFIDVAWDEKVLHHEDAIGKENGVSLSKREPSTDQVNKSINVDALTKWVDHIPADVKRDIEKIAPMLRRLGYDPHAYPPNYGTPDKEVPKEFKMVAAD